MTFDASFRVAAEAYDGFMGRYSRLLSPQLADLAGVHQGQRALDVGCGPGALTAELVARLGAGMVAAVDPSEPFVEAARARHVGVDVRRAAADALPFDDDAFDATLAQLVVHFMPDPVAGLTEMARVTRPGGVVAASVWDHAGGQGPLGLFWEVARELDPGVVDESSLPGARQGHLAELFGAAGLRDVRETSHAADLEHPSFEAWWTPFTHGVGPAGVYTGRLDPDRRAALRDRLRRRLPSGPFVVPARAWTARGVVETPAPASGALRTR
jgi:SAM-dependent methyltransferase